VALRIGRPIHEVKEYSMAELATVIEELKEAGRG